MKTKWWKRKKADNNVCITEGQLAPTEASQSDETTVADTANEMKEVVQTANEIMNQSPLQSLFSGSRNERALARNDEHISNVIKSILDWLAVITSSEMLRKEEYDALTDQMLQFNDDLNVQVQLQEKFKKAYEVIMQKQQEQVVLGKSISDLKRENVFLKIVLGFTFCIGCAALILAIL